MHDNNTISIKKPKWEVTIYYCKYPKVKAGKEDERRKGNFVPHFFYVHIGKIGKA